MTVSILDANGDPELMDEEWAAWLRVTKKKVGGETIVDVVMPVAAGVASLTIDTRDEIWEPGIYVYDTRVTGPLGYDRWSDPVQVKVKTRNSPPSE